MGFSQNTRGPNRYGLVVTDVFTRGDDGPGKRVSGGWRGALPEGPGGEGGPGRRRLGRARGGGDGSDGGATFRVWDNAEKFEHNKNLTEGRQRRLEEAGAFRAPTNAARSFQPQYGPVREVAGYDSMTVRATDGSQTLLKQALPVPRGSGEPRGRLTRPPVPLAVRQLRDFNPGPVAPP